MERYAVLLYNGNKDLYVGVGGTSDIEEAKNMCSVVAPLVEQKMIVDSHTDSREPFNWVEVYDKQDNKLIMKNKEVINLETT